LPKVAAVYAYVNQRLEKIRRSKKVPFDLICEFKAGDRYPRYRPFPVSIGMETVRKPVLASGLLALDDRFATH
jgi:hypothetical protein